MSNSPEYTDLSMLTWGKHQNVPLKEIPPGYLIDIYNGKNTCNDPLLIEYIKKNLLKLEVASGKAAKYYFQTGNVQQPACTKKQYASKALARDALKKIRNSPGDHKKPIRSYECPDCSTWHLTSVPYEVWKHKQQKLSKST